MEVEGTVRKAESGYEFAGILIRPTVTISNLEQRLRADWLLEKAKRLCLVARALGTQQGFETEVRVAAPVKGSETPVSG